MVPSQPEFDEKSHEDIVFEALKNLPPDCFVLHSLSILDPDLEDGDKKEAEIDFVVIIPDKGCVVIEAKSGNVDFTSSTTYFNGEEIPPYTWVYESGRPMKGNGPFRQARDNMYTLISYLKKTAYSNQAAKQKYYSCIWLQQTTKGTVKNYPTRPECPKELILTSEDLDSPLESLMRVISHQDPLIPKANKKPWNYQDAAQIVSNVLAPTMHLAPGKNWEYEYKTEKLNRLLIEQERILDFLSEQKHAVISGAAGTGKTMIALKKAALEADAGNKVLFLCYNAPLADFLAKTYKRQGVDYYNLSKWACDTCHSSSPDYGALLLAINKMIDQEAFPYKAIIVDEAQDFGQEVTDNPEIDILGKLQDAMILADGCFYLFYDKNQVVNSNRVPSFIRDADCKLTLYRNCRNTEKIAEASMAPLGQEPRLKPNVLIGDIPDVVFTNPENEYAELSRRIKKIAAAYKDVVILTAKSMNSTELYDKIVGQTIKLNGVKYPFYTCRQFKGLEADAIIVVDIDAHTFTNQKEKLLYYVGTSRAKFSLSILANMDEADCKSVCETLLGDSFIEGFDYKQQLAMALAITVQQ